MKRALKRYCSCRRKQVHDDMEEAPESPDAPAEATKGSERANSQTEAPRLSVQVETATDEKQATLQEGQEVLGLQGDVIVLVMNTFENQTEVKQAGDEIVEPPGVDGRALKETLGIENISVEMQKGVLENENTAPAREETLQPNSTGMPQEEIAGLQMKKASHCNTCESITEPLMNEMPTEGPETAREMENTARQWEFQQKHEVNNFPIAATDDVNPEVEEHSENGVGERIDQVPSKLVSKTAMQTEVPEIETETNHDKELEKIAEEEDTKKTKKTMEQVVDSPEVEKGNFENQEDAEMQSKAPTMKDAEVQVENDDDYSDLSCDGSSQESDFEDDANERIDEMIERILKAVSISQTAKTSVQNFEASGLIASEDCDTPTACPYPSSSL